MVIFFRILTFTHGIFLLQLQRFNSFIFYEILPLVTCGRKAAPVVVKHPLNSPSTRVLVPFPSSSCRLKSCGQMGEYGFVSCPVLNSIYNNLVGNNLHRPRFCVFYLLLTNKNEMWSAPRAVSISTLAARN